MCFYRQNVRVFVVHLHAMVAVFFKVSTFLLIRSPAWIIRNVSMSAGVMAENSRNLITWFCCMYSRLRTWNPKEPALHVTERWWIRGLQGFCVILEYCWLVYLLLGCNGYTLFLRVLALLGSENSNDTSRFLRLWHV